MIEYLAGIFDKSSDNRQGVNCRLRCFLFFLKIRYGRYGQGKPKLLHSTLKL